MQQQPQMLNPPTKITTEQIQKYLDENKQLIMAILENQRLGKIAECASYQAQLQQNLMYLARIADAQPQATTTIQMLPPGTVQQDPHAQPTQVTISQQQPGSVGTKLPFQLVEQQQHQPPFLQQQQLIQAQRSMGPDGPNCIYQSMHMGHGGNFMNVQGAKEDNTEAIGNGMGK